VLLPSEPRTIGRRSNEAALVVAAQSGDRAAFGALYKQFARMVHGILLAHVSYTEAEDLMQDVFVKAIEQIVELRETNAVGAWLASIARHAAFDHRRRFERLDQLPDSIVGQASPNQASPNMEVFEVLDLIQTLPESYRETLMLRLVEGMTGPEIAERTGLTEASVRVNLCRGMKMLKKLLDQPA
jgi:RNA polymerase sigma-70 factor (ECF subfamily)